MQNSTRSSHPTITEKDVQETVRRLADAESQYYNALGQKRESWEEIEKIFTAQELDRAIVKKLAKSEVVPMKEYRTVLEAMDTKQKHLNDYEVIYKDAAKSVILRGKAVADLRKQLEWMDKEMESRGKVYEFRKANS